MDPEAANRNVAGEQDRHLGGSKRSRCKAANGEANAAGELFSPA